jgi:hypothetical protein
VLQLLHQEVHDLLLFQGIVAGAGHDEDTLLRGVHDGVAEGLVVADAIGHRRSLPVVAEDVDVVRPAGIAACHVHDLGDAAVHGAHAAERGAGARPEVMGELVVYVVRGVDVRHAGVYVEEYGQRLQFAEQHIRADVQEGQVPPVVGVLAAHLAPQPHELLAHVLEHAVHQHAQHADGVQQQEQRHAAAAHLGEEPLRPLGGQREDGAVCAAVVDVDVAGAAVENAGLGEPVPDVLDIGGLGADDHAAVGLFVEAERGDVVLDAEEDGGLRSGRGAGQPRGVLPQFPAVALQQALHVGRVAAVHGPDQVLVGEGVDLDDNEAALVPFPALLPLAGEREVLCTVVKAVKRATQPLQSAWR